MTIRRRACVCAFVCFSCRYCFRKEEYDYQATCMRVCVHVCVRLCVSHVATISRRRSMTIRRRACVSVCVCFSCRYYFKKKEYDYQATCVHVCVHVCVFFMSLLFQEEGV